ncbi:MAG: DEAD/DEAH box helicase [Deltaproteobacteria bacterium]|nr:DEAD/DEAH box helicase [Deltaproteobacteria bacterium]
MSDEEAESAFQRLSPAVQYHIANTLGFTVMRPVQELTAHAILDGDNVVVLAPTAGGKTEAAFFPLLSRIESEDWKTPSVLYLSPINALLNNQEHRLRSYAEMLSRRVFKWHGDVGPTLRKKFLEDPADILMTTPESLEVMLVSQKVASRRLFRHLQAVVIDEVHAFAGDDRGAHLVSVLERLQRICGKDIQRIGLSATVGNPEEILSWLSGTSKRGRRLVNPPKPPSAPVVELDWVATLSNAAKVIASLHQGKKRLVFVDSRRKVEQLGELLLGHDIDTYLMHSSLSADERRQTEAAFEQGTNCIIVATSTMELGIDVGDLDAVLQINSPPSVASFLQRMGRSGRRKGTTSNCTILCTEEDDLVQAAGLLRLWKKGYVEPVVPERNAYHLLAHQLLVLCLQESGIATSDWWGWVEGAGCFQDISMQERMSLVEKMLKFDIIHESGARYWLGDTGEKLYGRRNFKELYAVFDAAPILRVMWGKDEIGTVDAQFIQGLDPGAAFVLGGKPWKISHIDWKKGRCAVVPSSYGQHVSWRGGAKYLSRALSEEMRSLLAEENADEWWTPRAQKELASYRASHAFVHDEERPLVQRKSEYRWYSFLGGRVNNLLARLLEERLGSRVLPGNLMLTFKEDAAKSEVAIRQEIAELMQPGAVTWDDAIRYADTISNENLSKFQPCLPERLELLFLAKRVFELPFPNQKMD